MNDKRKYITAITHDILKYGIKSMSMDDIARILGMSKKTLYQHFKDKEEIVRECVGYIKDGMTAAFERNTSQKQNFIEIEVGRARKMLELNYAVKATFIFDLKKFYPAEYEDLSTFKNELLYKISYHNVKMGKEQGYVRENLDPAFLAKLYVTLMNAIFSADVSGFTEEDITSGRYSDSFIHYEMHAICTQKGLDEFYRLMDEKKKNK